jgi:YidC/Oxa1 family membrane protein insertase
LNQIPQMDRNTLTGLLLIVLVYGIYMWATAPTAEQIAQKQLQDSLARVATNPVTAANDTSNNAATSPANTTVKDSAAINNGIFRQTAQAEQFLAIENDLLKIELSNQGGRIFRTELKKYQTYDKQPLILNDGEANSFNYKFYVGTQPVETQQYKFEGKQNSPNSVTYRLYADSVSYMEQTYTLKEGSYVVDYQLNMVGMEKRLLGGSPLQLDWRSMMLTQEKITETERAVTGVYFKEHEEGASWLSETGDDAKTIETPTDWVSFKQHFFNQTLIAPTKPFKSAKLAIAKPAQEDGKSLELASSVVTFDYEATPTFNYPMQLYMGPNHYATLRKMGMDMQRLLPLGWGIFGWCNKLIIIPVFNLLSKFIGNYGIIILLLTLIIKFALMPLSYRSFRSFAKMNVLKPELEAIRAQFPDDKQRQQMETMQLYNKAGVSPMGGCIPQLIQFPILVAMYRFFPASIELRQEKFLWANDLSSYDSIFNLPFNIPFYGDHVSLFCILSAVSTYFSTKLNSQMSPQSGNDELALQMKMMQNIMPFMLLFFFNSMAAGLTYYFFLSNVIGFAQQWAIKKYFIDDNKLRQEIEANKSKPKEVSGLQQMIEQRLREQQQQGKK